MRWVVVGISPDQTKALRQVAFDELAASGGIRSMPLNGRDRGGPSRCRDLH